MIGFHLDPNLEKICYTNKQKYKIFKLSFILIYIVVKKVNICLFIHVITPSIIKSKHLFLIPPNALLPIFLTSYL